MEESELRQLVEKLVEVLSKRRGLGVQSRWALSTAMSAAETQGIEATLVMKIPREDRIDLEFHAGTVEVVHGRPRSEVY